MQVLPSKAAAKRESASETLDKIGIKHGSARNRPVMTAKASPTSCQRQDKHNQQQSSRRAVGGKEATAYCSVIPLTRPSNILDKAKQDRGTRRTGQTQAGGVQLAWNAAKRQQRKFQPSTTFLAGRKQEVLALNMQAPHQEPTPCFTVESKP